MIRIGITINSINCWYRPGPNWTRPNAGQCMKKCSAFYGMKAVVLCRCLPTQSMHEQIRLLMVKYPKLMLLMAVELSNAGGLFKCFLTVSNEIDCSV